MFGTLSTQWHARFAYGPYYVLIVLVKDELSFYLEIQPGSVAADAPNRRWNDEAAASLFILVIFLPCSGDHICLRNFVV